MQKVIRQLSQNPKRLFFIDALGAFLTFSFLFVILTTFQPDFGMPSTILVLLMILALLFSTLSIFCFYFVKSKWQPFLKAISLANVLYCALTATLIVYHFKELTVLGIIYFLLEIVVISVLAFIEKSVSEQK